MALFRKRREPARLAVADLDGTVLEAAGHPVALREVVVGARVGQVGLEVDVHHPVFADLPEDARVPAATEVLVATLGADVVSRTVGEVRGATYPPIDCFGLEALRAFVRGQGVPVETEPPADPTGGGDPGDR